MTETICSTKAAEIARRLKVGCKLTEKDILKLDGMPQGTNEFAAACQTVAANYMVTVSVKDVDNVAQAYLGAMDVLTALADFVHKKHGSEMVRSIVDNVATVERAIVRSKTDDEIRRELAKKFMDRAAKDLGEM